MVGDRGIRILFFVQRPPLDRGINQAEVIDAGIRLRGGAGLDEVGDRDRGQQADNSHDDHDLDERETCLGTYPRFHFGVFNYSNRTLILGITTALAYPHLTRDHYP